MSDQKAIKSALKQYEYAINNYGFFKERFTFEETLAVMKALEKHVEIMPENIRPHVDHKTGNCPSCGIYLAHFGDTNYCHKCGKKLDWRDEDEQR